MKSNTESKYQISLFKDEVQKWSIRFLREMTLKFLKKYQIPSKTTIMIKPRFNTIFERVLIQEPSKNKFYPKSNKSIRAK